MPLSVNLSAGMGGMGGAQPLAGVLAGAAILVVDVDPARIRRRLDSGYCQRLANSLDHALALVRAARDTGTALSVGLVGNAAEVYPELVRRASRRTW